MPETEHLSPRLQEGVDKIDVADVVIGLPAYKTNEDLKWVGDFGGAEFKILIAYPEGSETVEPLQFPGIQFIRYPLSAQDRLLLGYGAAVDVTSTAVHVTGDVVKGTADVATGQSDDDKKKKSDDD